MHWRNGKVWLSFQPGGDRYLLELVSKAPAAKVVALNKIDLVRKPKLLPRIARYQEAADFAGIDRFPADEAWRVTARLETAGMPPTVPRRPRSGEMEAMVPSTGR